MDRLLQVEDKEWFLSQCETILGNQFSTSLDELIGHWTHQEGKGTLDAWRKYSFFLEIS